MAGAILIVIDGASALVLKYTMGGVVHALDDFLTNIISRINNSPDIKLSRPADPYISYLFGVTVAALDF